MVAITIIGYIVTGIGLIIISRVKPLWFDQYHPDPEALKEEKPSLGKDLNVMFGWPVMVICCFVTITSGAIMYACLGVALSICFIYDKINKTFYETE